nr:hemicentin-1 isoform X2 [Ciona intestinalis]|eukprot:XP_002126696.1 hemicentin-1 isoform X2 [Ciona intestinalis]
MELYSNTMPQLCCLIVLILWLLQTVDSLVVPARVEGLKQEQVTLTCSYVESGSTPPTISWAKNEADGRTSIVASSVSGFSHISETFAGRASLSGANLTISLLKLSDAGSYTCNVIAVGSPQESGTTVLSVTATPDISAFSIKAPIVESNQRYGAAICTAVGGQPRAVITWTDSSGKVQPSRVTFREADDGSVNVESVLLLHVGLLGRAGNITDPVTLTDRIQEFTCRVKHSNLDPTEDRRVNVELMFPPVAHISLLGNQLTCNVEGNPQPTLKWFLPTGEVLRNSPTVYVTPTSSGNGRYVCTATSNLGPTATAFLDVNKAEDLPVLFRTLVQLNTSLPVTASGFEIECSADLVSTGSNLRVGYDVRFEWSKDGIKIRDSLSEYSIIAREKRLPSGAVRLTSSLRFVNVRRGRDDADFRCRLVNTTRITGFVSALERTVKIVVDYPPESRNLRISSEPSHGVVKEGGDLQLHCSTSSNPISQYDWYFQGTKIGTGSSFRIQNLQRHQAGTYQCVAYNYVPGSANGDVAVMVEYPPSNVIVTQNENELTCVAESGSIPEPMYKWILPNGTETAGNKSRLFVTPSSAGQYTCSVSNIHGRENVTFIYTTELIGSLSVAEFVTTLVLCIVFAVILACIIGWFTYKRCPFRKPHEAVSDEKATVRNLRFTECKSPLPPDEEHGTNIVPKLPAITRTRIDQSTPAGSNGDRYRCYMAVDGSSIEIVENESLPSPQLNYKQIREERAECEKSTQYAKIQKRESQDLDTPSENLSQATREATIPSPVRLAKLRRDTGRIVHEPANVIPMQYFHQATLPRTARLPPKVPLHYPPPLGVMVTGYEPVLYDETWRPGIPHYVTCSASHIGPYASLNVNSRHRADRGSEETTIHSDTSTTTSDDYLHGVKRNLPRSMSLSASDSSSATTSDSSHSASTQQSDNPSKTNLQCKKVMEPTSFDSGNDSVKSTTGTTKRHQSLTLV